MRITVIACTLLFIIALVFSQEKNTTEPNFEKVLYTDYFVLKYMPDTSFRPLLNKIMQEVKPNVGGEVLYSFEVTPHSKLTEDSLDEKMFNVLLNVESLKGIYYYSNSRKKYREFILESYRVDSLENQHKINISRISDMQAFPVEGEEDIVSYEFLMYQKDSSFGTGVKKIIIYYNKSLHEMYMYITNLENIMYKNFIRIAQPNALTLAVLVQRENHVYKEYMMAGVYAKNAVQFIKEKISKSLTYRMYAMGIWFEDQIKKVL